MQSKIPENTYYPISRFYVEQFGEKVYKIPVTVVDDCPNRKGLKGMQTCIFCDVWGSAAYKDSFGQPLRDQIDKVKAHLGTRFKARKFLVYFQAYTNTFSSLKAQQANIDLALSYPDVVGIVIGTRPDCLSPALLRMWEEYSKKTAVYIELGVQTFFDDQLEFIRRGHTAQQSIDAIQKIKSEIGVNVGIHLMFGLPGETDEQMIETARIVSSLPIDNVKLHNLHVLKNTPLEELYHQGQFKPIEMEDYSRRVQIFLQHLSPNVPVHRLGALASRWDELIAPEWTRYKMLIQQTILDQMAKQKAYQGQYYVPPSFN